MNIIYSHNINKAVEKLEEIRKQKRLIEIKRNHNNGEITYVFEDEVWKWVRPSYKVRGNRVVKCLVDASSVTLKECWEIILPSCIYGESDVDYF